MELKIDELYEYNKELETFKLKCKFNNKKNTLLISNENSEGKTTLLRSIIFCLGFDVNTISEGYDKLRPNLKLSFIIDGEEYSWTRDFSNSGFIYQQKPNAKIYEIENDKDIIANVFGFEDYEFLNSILGAMYIDQDFGWRTINHGRVHPNRQLKFNFPKILSRIYGHSALKDDDLESQIKKLNQRKKMLLKMLSAFRVETPVEISSKNKFILNEIAKISSNIQKYELMNKKAKQIPDDINLFIKLVSKNQVLKKIVPESKINILKNINKFEKKLSENDIKKNRRIIDNLNKKKGELDNVISKNLSLADGYENVEKAINNLININSSINKINEDGVQFKLAEIQQQINDLNIYKKEIKNKNNEKFEQTFNLLNKSIIESSGLEIGTSPNIFMSWNQSPIFNSYSGAKKALIILLTRIIVLKELSDNLNIKLPFIVDTLISFDPADKTKDNLYNILKIVSESSPQLIIANVNKEMNKDIEKIINPQIIAVKSDFRKKETVQMKLDLFKY